MKTVFLVLMLAFAGNAAAQSSSVSNTNANGTGMANSSNAGVNAAVNQYGTDQLHESVNAQVPLSVVGYGSFSQASCMPSTGGGMSTKVFSFVYNAPTADVNCQHVVRADSFGRASQNNFAQGDTRSAAANRHMVDYSNCTADEDTKRACLYNQLIKLDPTKPNGNKDGTLAVLPKTPEDDIGKVPSRPAGWNSQMLQPGDPAYRPLPQAQVEPKPDDIVVVAKRP